MAGKKLELGPVGDVVAKNVTRFRKAAGLNYTELSARLAENDRDIPPLAVRRIEEGNRRVDVDDLVALAIVLNVSPLALLLPRVDSQLTVNGEVYPVARIWEWGHGRNTLRDGLPEPVVFAFGFNSNPLHDWAETLGLSGERAEQLRKALAGTPPLAPDGVDLRDGGFSLTFRTVDEKGRPLYGDD